MKPGIYKSKSGIEFPLYRIPEYYAYVAVIDIDDAARITIIFNSELNIISPEISSELRKEFNSPEFVHEI